MFVAIVVSFPMSGLYPSSDLVLCEKGHGSGRRDWSFSTINTMPSGRKGL
jgi:hypothetical protein